MKDAGKKFKIIRPFDPVIDAPPPKPKKKAVDELDAFLKAQSHPKPEPLLPPSPTLGTQGRSDAKFEYYEYPSSKSTPQKPKMYTVQVETKTGIMSCNCQGWIIKKVGKTRECRHTKKVQARFPARRLVNRA